MIAFLELLAVWASMYVDDRLPPGADPLGRYGCLHPDWDPEDWVCHGELHVHRQHAA